MTRRVLLVALSWALWLSYASELKLMASQVVLAREPSADL